MNTSNKKWSERFEEQFIESHPGDSGPGGNTPQEPVYHLTIDPNDLDDIKSLKSFIQAELSRLGAEILSVIPEYKKTTDPLETYTDIRQAEIQNGDWATADSKAGYNQGLKDTRQAIEEKIKE